MVNLNLSKNFGDVLDDFYADRERPEWVGFGYSVGAPEGHRIPFDTNGERITSVATREELDLLLHWQKANLKEGAGR